MRKNFLTLLTSFIMLCLTSVVLASSEPPPMLMLQKVSTNILGELDKNIANLQKDNQLVSQIVERNLVPYVDVTGMSQNVIGRSYWQSASPQLRKEFTEQFTKYVIKTYANAFASYNRETITFSPIRGYDPTQTRVQINSSINRSNGPAIRVQYRVIKLNNQWLIYDFSVDGVSFIQNYRSQFAGTLTQGGLPLLVQQLKAKN